MKESGLKSAKEHGRERAHYAEEERTATYIALLHVSFTTEALQSVHHVSVWGVCLLYISLLLLSSLPFCIYLSTHAHETHFFSNGIFSTTHSVHTPSYSCPEERRIPLCAITHPHTPLSIPFLSPCTCRIWLSVYHFFHSLSKRAAETVPHFILNRIILCMNMYPKYFFRRNEHDLLKLCADASIADVNVSSSRHWYKEWITLF